MYLRQHERSERERQQTIARKGMASEHPNNPGHLRNVAQPSPIHINRTADSSTGKIRHSAETKISIAADDAAPATP